MDILSPKTTCRFLLRKSLLAQPFLGWLLWPLAIDAQDTLPPMKGLYHGSIVTEEQTLPATLLLTQGIASNHVVKGTLTINSIVQTQIGVECAISATGDLITLAEEDSVGIWESKVYSSLQLDGSFSNNPLFGNGSFAFSWKPSPEKLISRPDLTKNPQPQAHGQQEFFSGFSDKPIVSTVKPEIAEPNVQGLLINPGFEIRDPFYEPRSATSESSAKSAPPRFAAAEDPPNPVRSTPDELDQYQAPSWWQQTKSFLGDSQNQEAILHFTFKALEAYFEFKNGSSSGFHSGPSHSNDFRTTPVNPGQHWVYPNDGSQPYLRTNPDGNPWNNLNAPNYPNNFGY